PARGPGRRRGVAGGRPAGAQAPVRRAGRPRPRLRDRDALNGRVHSSTARTASSTGPSTSGADGPPACQLAISTLTHVSTVTPNVAAHSGSTYRKPKNSGNTSQTSGGTSIASTAQASVPATRQSCSVA